MHDVSVHPAHFPRFEGGPCAAALRALRLEGEERCHVERGMAVAVLVRWLPLVVLSAIDGRAIASDYRDSMLLDAAMFGRSVIALPLLLLAVPTFATAASAAARSPIRAIDRRIDHSFRYAIRGLAVVMVALLRGAAAVFHAQLANAKQRAALSWGALAGRQLRAFETRWLGEQRPETLPAIEPIRRHLLHATSIRKECDMATERNDMQRSILPIPHRERVVVNTYDAKDPNTRFSPIEPIRPPKGAPNVLIVLLDDVGFGASSAFGGPVNMPTAERLAGGGLEYTRFHTTALCSPTRQALLTGRNHHSVGMGCITEMATSAPGYTSIRPNNKAPLAEILKLNGYATAQFGKCHEVPVWQTGPIGPFDQWPTGGGGFEYFYGFLGGECNQYEPELYEGTTPVTPRRTAEEGYHLTKDLADHAINWVRQQKALLGDAKPFFMYFAPGATHAPHQVPKAWADKYKGKFDHGWDRQRELTFARQKTLGVIPPHAELTQRHAEIPAWDATPAELKPVLARQMEVYAGFLEHTDHQVGRLVDALADLGVLDDTLVYYIIGDNGASAEGTLQGTFNEMVLLNGITGIETTEFLRAHIDEFGSPKAYNHYAVGWAHAMCTPYQWTKQIASHWGGTRNATIVHWPEGINAKGELRHQFSHVIDVAPTILDAARIPDPEMVHGITQSPMEGTSMRYSFDAANAPERHDVQYFEMFGNRGIYHKGWSAITKHRTPWLPTAAGGVAFDQDVWELYDGSKDWTQACDLAKQLPDKLRELHVMFAMEAVKYNVFPLDDRMVERIDPAVSGRQVLVKGTSQLLFEGTGRLPEAAVVSIKNASFSVTAELEVPDKPAEGVIVAQGGRFGGWSLYAKDGKATFTYNWFGLRLYQAQAEVPIPAGEHQVRAEFAYDGGGVGKGGNMTLYYDGKSVGRGRIEHTQPLAFSAEETTDVGYESGSLVTSDYSAHDGRFTGTIHWVQLDVGKDNFSHLIKPEDRLRVMMVRQ